MRGITVDIGHDPAAPHDHHVVTHGQDLRKLGGDHDAHLEFSDLAQRYIKKLREVISANPTVSTYFEPEPTPETE